MSEKRSPRTGKTPKNHRKRISSTQVAENLPARPVYDRNQPRSAYADAMAQYLEDLVTVCSALLADYFDNVEDLTATSPQTQKATNPRNYENYQRYAEQVRDAKEFSDGSYAEDLWKGIQLASQDRWLARNGIDDRTVLTYLHKAKLIRMPNQEDKIAVIKQFFRLPEEMQSPGKLGKMMTGELSMQALTGESEEHAELGPIDYTKEPTVQEVIQRLKANDIAILAHPSYAKCIMKARSGSSGTRAELLDALDHAMEFIQEHLMSSLNGSYVLLGKPDKVLVVKSAGFS